MRRSAILAVAAAIASLLAGVAIASGAGARAGAVVKTRHTSLGTIVANAKGRTLYLFMKDKNGKSACSRQCATYWPPLLTSAKPRAGAGVKASLLGTTRRANGRLQVTYNKHPLYAFSGDTGPGSTAGEEVKAFGADWYAISPAGAKVEKKSSSSGGGGYGGYGG